MKLKKTKADKYLLLSWRKAWMIVVGWFLAVMLHNIIYALGIYFFGTDFWGVNGDEPFFFLIAIILIPLYVITAGIYSLIRLVRK